jgi:hypothetical protein
VVREVRGKLARNLEGLLRAPLMQAQQPQPLAGSVHTGLPSPSAVVSLKQTGVPEK